jgi:hypothetical protein
MVDVERVSDGEQIFALYKSIDRVGAVGWSKKFFASRCELRRIEGRAMQLIRAGAGHSVYHTARGASKLR